jgi:hypothetical protein
MSATILNKTKINVKNDAGTRVDKLARRKQVHDEEHEKYVEQKRRN